MFLKGNPYTNDPPGAWNGDYMGDKEAKREAKTFARRFPGGAVGRAESKPFGALDLTPYAAGSAEADRVIQTLADENAKQAQELGIDPDLI